MAVLHLLLQRQPRPNAINRLAPAISRHDEWLQKSHILLVPYHMIGAASIEAGILGGYTRYILKAAPGCASAGFYLSSRLFRDAKQLRSSMGDETFFKLLNKDAKGSGMTRGIWPPGGMRRASIRSSAIRRVAMIVFVWSVT